MYITLERDVYSEKKYLTLFFWAFQLIIRRFTATAMTILGLAEYVEYINVLLWLCVAVFCLKAIVSSIGIMDIAAGIFVVLFFIVASRIWPFNEFIVKNRWNYLLTVLPFLYVGKGLVIDKQILMQMKNISSAVIFLNYIVYFFYYKRGGGTGIFNDNLAFAYDLLPHVALLLYFALRDKTTIDALLFISSFILLLMQGTRGPILLIAFIIIWYFYSSRSFGEWFIESIFLIVFCVTVLFSGIFEFLIKLLISIGQSLGVSTRIFETLLERNGTGLRSNFWREYIFKIILEGIKKRPFSGYGPFGDYFLTQNDMHFQGGIYAHNFFVELICDYGIIIGVTLIALLFAVILKSYNRSSDIETRLMIILLMSNSLFKFFFSGSYLFEPVFYVLLGFLFSTLPSDAQGNKIIISGRRV